MTTRETALSLARVLLKADMSNGSLTTALIEERVRTVLQMLQMQGQLQGTEATGLVRELQALFDVFVGPATIIDVPDHIPWLADRRGAIPWKFWKRYMQYLEEDKQFPPKMLSRLDSLTDGILERLEDPTRTGCWDRRGLVVGHVQSGKTGNYTGVICKALDAGYKLVVVLAGVHNSLRSQTQLRLDEGILGFDTRDRIIYDDKNKRIGVGRLGERLIANSFTHSGENGDFNTKVASQVFVSFGTHDPFILVVKKNATVLRNLIQWSGLQGVKDDKGMTRVRDVPLLVIDDEADNASIDTEKKSGRASENVSRINSLIRELLNTFDQSAYLGYTATPFANIFIDPDATAALCGDDLFPRDFIINLPVPSNYVGPARVFGLLEDHEVGVEAQDALPITRVIEDQEDWMPISHKKDHDPPFLPPSLKEALGAFVISSALRIHRGQEQQHNSMLIHVTRFTAVQKAVAELVEEEVAGMRRRLEYEDGTRTDSLKQALKGLWQTDFLPTSEAMGQTENWAEVEDLLFKVIARMQVRTINGTASDILDYRDYKNGLSVIAVGGDKLSRGLTLEGLSVSYYLRASKMYDTLMQMGRWFGYRPGYLDLCRLYTSPELRDWYRHITMASEELRKEFDFMALTGRTPTEFGLRVRTHPDALMVTAANKMRSGTVVRVSYARTLSETVVFSLRSPDRQQNWTSLERFIGRISTGHGGERKVHWRWKQPQWTWSVAGKDITDFLSTYSTHPESPKTKAQLLNQYIKKQQLVNELTDWTVVLLSNSKAQRQIEIGPCSIGMFERKRENSRGDMDKYSIGRLVSPRDESLDLDEESFHQALQHTARHMSDRNRKEMDHPLGLHVREVRNPKCGLMLIYPLDVEGKEVPRGQPLVGIALSFPDSKHAQCVEYVVNNPYFEQEYLTV